MGGKTSARAVMAAAGVPIVPGDNGVDGKGFDTLDAAGSAAAKLGYPVMLKAAAGGGGRGMRLVGGPDDLGKAFEGARREALAGFGDDTVYLEKAIIRPRHIEIQVFADKHGNVVHMGERDCSVQRRNQKVIEEAPSPAIDVGLRTKMGAVAVAAARAVNYEGAGTVEMLFDGQSRDFYFLEMNTRLQVEHPVTEMITGIDLVAWQIHVAAGGVLPSNRRRSTFQGLRLSVGCMRKTPFGSCRPPVPSKSCVSPKDQACASTAALSKDQKLRSTTTP